MKRTNSNPFIDAFTTEELTPTDSSTVHEPQTEKTNTIAMQLLEVSEIPTSYSAYSKCEQRTFVNLSHPIEQVDEHGRTALFKAASASDYEKVKELLEQGCDPNKSDNYGDTPLIAAITYFNKSYYNKGQINCTGKQFSLIKLLLQHKSNPNHVGALGYTPFEWGFMLRDYPEILRILSQVSTVKPSFRDKCMQIILNTTSTSTEFLMYLNMFPEYDFISKDNYTPLHALVKDQDFDGIKALSQAHPLLFKRYLACTTTKKYYERKPTCLHLALENYKNFSIADFLIEKGAQISQLNDLLFKFDLSIDLLQWLIKNKIDLNTQNINGDTALHYWASNTYNEHAIALAKELISAGASLTIKNNDTKTSIDIARENNHQRVLETMFHSHQASQLKYPKLHQIIKEGNVKTFTENLETEDLKQKDCFGFSIAESAICAQQLDILKLIHDKQSLVNIHPLTDFDIESSLLFRAIQLSATDIFKFLLECGFDKQLQENTYSAKKLFTFALQNNRTEIIDSILPLILKSSPNDDFEDFFITSLQQKNISCANHFFAFFRSPHKRDRENNTIFHLAIEMGNFEFANKLLDKFQSNCYLNCENDKNETPLDLAIKNKHFELAQIIFNQIKNFNDYHEDMLFKHVIQIGVLDNLKELLNNKKFLLNLDESIIVLDEISRTKIDLLSYAALLGCTEIVDFLVKRKAPLQYSRDELSSIPIDRVFYHALLSKNQSVLETIMIAYDAQNKTPFYEELFAVIFANPDEIVQTNLWHIYIRSCNTGFEENEIQVISTLLKTMSKNLSSFYILKNGLMQCNSAEKLIQYLNKAIHFSSTLENHYKEVYYNELSQVKDRLENDLQQIFFHIFLGMNPGLSQEHDIFEKLGKILKMAKKPEDYGMLFTALQVCQNFELAEYAFEVGLHLDEKGSYSTDTELNQKKWLAYVFVYRSRQGLAYCHNILKNADKHPELISYALQALESIGISQLNKKLSNKQIPLLKKIISDEERLQVRILAIKALSALASYSNQSVIIHFLIEQLQQDSSDNLLASPVKIAILQAFDKMQQLGKDTHKIFIDKVIALTQDKDLDVKWHAMLLLSSLPHEKGLLTALQMIKDPLYAGRYDKQYGLNKQNTVGNFLCFRSRPHHLHDNRAALIERIEYNLGHLKSTDISFQQDVETKYSEFCKDHSVNKELLLIKQELEGSLKVHIRYLNTPIFFPSGTSLIRGLSTRKGKASFHESLRDFIRKGSGTAALTDHEANDDGGTWKKIGHVFASHNAELFFTEKEGCTYFSTDEKGNITDSALIIFPSTLFEKEALRGQARMEIVETYNNVLYQGIPKSWTTALYLPESFRADIEALSGEAPIQTVMKTLQNETFNTLSDKELIELRRHLQANDSNWTGTNEQEVPFYKKIRFFPTNKGISAVKEALKQDELKFSTEEDVMHETLKGALKRQLIRKIYSNIHKDPYLFYMPENYLTELSPIEFLDTYSSFREALPRHISSHLPEQSMLVNIDSTQLNDIENLFAKIKGVAKGRAISRLAALGRLALQKNKALSISNLKNSLFFNPSFFGLTSVDIQLVIALSSTIQQENACSPIDEITSIQFAELVQHIAKVIKI